MLEKLILQNFQKWPQLEIEFDPFLTILYGPTGVGKSCALRGLTWVCLNEPRGTGYMRRGSKATEVTLHLDSGHTVRRYRNQQGNGYEFNGQHYEALNGGVPDAIANLLSISSANISDQFEAPYWMLLSKPEVARQLNAIVNLELIDRTLEDFASQVRRAKDNVTNAQERLEQITQRRDDLAWVLDADLELQAVEELATELQTMNEKEAKLKRLLEQIDAQDAVLVSGEEEMTHLNEIKHTGESIQNLQEQIALLKGVLKHVGYMEERIRGAVKDLQAQQVFLQEYTSKRCPTCGQYPENNQ